MKKIIIISAFGALSAFAYLVQAGQITVQGSKEGAIHGNAGIVQGVYEDDATEISAGGNKLREDDTGKLREDGTNKLRE